MVSLDVCGVRMCLRGYLGANPLQGGEFTLFWHSPERQDFFHLAILRYQNIKMSTYILNKNGWVLPFFSFLVPVRDKLKNTVTWITLYQLLPVYFAPSTHVAAQLARPDKSWQNSEASFCY